MSEPIAPPPSTFGQPQDAPAMKRCPACAEEVLAKAKVCKHCGKKLATQFSVGQIAGAGLILVLVFLFLASIVGSWG